MLECMTTGVTITTAEDLLDRTETRAPTERATVSSMIEEEPRLAEARRAQQESSGAECFRLPTFDVGEPKPDVDIDDNAALRDFMDAE